MTRRYGVKAINPDDPDGDQVDIWFPGDLVMGYYKNDRVNYWNLETAKHVLEDPVAVYQGIREYKKGGFCYVGRPNNWYVGLNAIATFPRNRIFCVYVNPAKYVYEFRAEPADSVLADIPKDHDKRFRSKLWPTTS